MRLLECGDGEFKLTGDLVSDIPKYAILSHTWGPDTEEVSFKDLVDGTGKNKAGYKKIRFCVEQARRDGLRYCWVDTCCIDKTNNNELTKAINSMFRWYQDAARCYVYLSDISASGYEEDSRQSELTWESAFRASKWFTRGWTLQELLAPASVEFFMKDGQRLGDKRSLEQQIHEITGIALPALRGSALSQFDINERFRWAKTRQTTLEEDWAYCLLGIFGIFMPLIYGEGKAHAVRRLKKVIAESMGHNDHWDNDCLNALRITDPRHDKMRIESDKGGLLDDVHQWVLSNNEFLRWQYDEQNRLLWVKGDPGKGKTMLLCGMINELEKKGIALSFFFCQATDARLNSATGVLRGLIYMLVDRQPSLYSHVQKRYDVAGRQLFEDINAWVALREIFMDILYDPELHPSYLVVDALDECQTGRSELLDLIAICTTVFRVKWVVSSRNWPEIEEKLTNAGQNLSLELNAESVSAAVQLYVWEKAQRLAEEKGYDAKMTAEVTSYLSSNAKDTFLWVALVCQGLKKVHKKVPWFKVLIILHSFPAGLDALYARMMEQIHGREDVDDVDLCMQILSITLTVYRPVTLEELGSLIARPISSPEFERLSDGPLDTRRDDSWLEYYVELCGSFLAIRERTIYFIHQSAKDFLCSRSLNAQFHNIFPAAIGGMHHTLFSRSLKTMSIVLRRDIYHLEESGIAIEHITPPSPDPLALARYSCLYWVDHLFDAHASNIVVCANDLQDRGTVHGFLRDKYLYWLEALSLVQDMPKGVLAVEKLHGLVQSIAEGSQLSLLVRDMRRFILTYRFAVENAPLQAYASALIFSPARSWTRRLFQREEPKWFADKSIVEEDWSACVTTFEGHSHSVNSVAFSPDGRQLASASYDKTVKLWDITTGACITTLKGHSRLVNSVAFSPDGRQLASASYDKTVKLWDITTGACITTFEGHSRSVNSVAFSPDGRQLASVSSDMTVKLWDVTTGACITTFEGHSHFVNSVAFSPDGEQLASASYDMTVRLWDITTGACITTFEGHSHTVNSVAFSPDGRQLASVSSDKTVKLWDITKGACITTLEGHSDFVNSVAFSPDGRQLASASYDMTVKLWDITTGACITTLKGHSRSVNSVAFSPDGRQLASASYDKTVKLWDITTGACITKFEGHSHFVNSVAFSPDGRQLASASFDMTVKLWDVTTGACITTFEGHSHFVNSVAFSPDGQQLASASYDTTVKLWDVMTGGCLKTIHVNMILYQMYFDDTGTCLNTEQGTIDIGLPPLPKNIINHESQNASGHRYGISDDRVWITYHTKNLLWLPSEYRPSSLAVKDSTIGIGCTSGRVWFLRLSKDTVPV